MTTPKTIAAGTDFSDLGDLAVDCAMALARRVGAVRVHLVHVIQPASLYVPVPYAMSPQDLDGLDLQMQKDALARLEKIQAEDLQITREVRFGIPARDLAEAAAEVEADAIVVGTHGYGPVRRALLGSVTASLVRLARCPVLVVSSQKHSVEFTTVVAGVDLSPISRAVVDAAVTYAKKDGRVEVVCAFDEMRPLNKERRQAAKEEGARALAELLPKPEGGPAVAGEVLDKAPPWNVLMETVDILAADLLVVGTSGHNAFERAFLGSTATRVLAEADCPVLVVPNKQS